MNYNDKLLTSVAIGFVAMIVIVMLFIFFRKEDKSQFLQNEVMRIDQRISTVRDSQRKMNKVIVDELVEVSADSRVVRLQLEQLKGTMNEYSPYRRTGQPNRRVALTNHKSKSKSKKKECEQ